MRRDRTQEHDDFRLNVENEAAAPMEKDLAEDLRRVGHTVMSGHQHGESSGGRWHVIGDDVLSSSLLPLSSDKCMLGLYSEEG